MLRILIVILLLINVAYASDGTAGPTSSAQAHISITILPRIQTSLNTKSSELTINSTIDYNVVVYEDSIPQQTIRNKRIVQLKDIIKEYKEKHKKKKAKKYRMLLLIILASCI